MANLTVQAAYGRSYNSKSAVLSDWNADKDFQCIGYAQYGYVNKPDFEKNAKPGDMVEVRYGKRGEKVMIITKA